MLYSLLERINPDHNFPVRTTSQPAASLNTTSSVGQTVSASEWPCYQPGQPALRSKPHPVWEKETQKSNCWENDIKKMN
ncbi:hypothetical protein PFLUV_G00137170 [Perca fluviatilis]|uniref:Uncharacterized protein n=1 Tax=Perca fluviatilis TaxID=8168 RepID=A0A6A5F840_PERFL|nr:hypothetical protein PFLUV_G00137170 [Perca fluviatilis]